MKPKITGKRIVSKGEYARQIVLKSFLLFLGAIAGIVMFVCLKNMLRLWLTRPEGIPTSIGFVFLGVAVIMLACYGLAMSSAMRVAKSVNVDVPLTRANTANLPAPDSLVRASEEPMQAQGAILLRAALEGQERHEEQLVRAVNGQE